MKDSTTDKIALVQAKEVQLVNSPGRLDRSFDCNPDHRHQHSGFRKTYNFRQF